MRSNYQNYVLHEPIALMVRSPRFSNCVPNFNLSIWSVKNLKIQKSANPYRNKVPGAVKAREPHNEPYL